MIYFKKRFITSYCQLEIKNLPINEKTGNNWVLWNHINGNPNNISSHSSNHSSITRICKGKENNPFYFLTTKYR